MARKPFKIPAMKTAELWQSIRKPMPPPSAIMGERKRKNAYSRKTKFKKDLTF